MKRTRWTIIALLSLSLMLALPTAAFASITALARHDVQVSGDASGLGGELRFASIDQPTGEVAQSSTTTVLLLGLVVLVVVVSLALFIRRALQQAAPDEAP